jgi:hypothetical protein
MNWEYIGPGLGVLAIGIALVVGVPPPWWPEMPRGLVKAAIAFGLVFFVASLFLLAIGLSPALKDIRRTWPQIGMIVSAAAFIVCGAWYFLSGLNSEPETPQRALAEAPPPPATPQPQIRANPGIDLNQYPRKTCFDYSTNDGLVKLALNAITFEIRFNKASNESIHVYKDGTNLRALARLREMNPGDDIDFYAFDSSSRVYTVSLGGYFIAQNVDGYFLLARILSIKDDTRGDTSDEVCFAYSIDTSKSGRFKAL